LQSQLLVQVLLCSLPWLGPLPQWMLDLLQQWLHS
jgi:hypothetical protein